MAHHMVTCVRRDDDDRDFRIQGIGGTGPEGPWFLPIDDAIRRIESGADRFYVSGGGSVADVLVETHEDSGRKFLKTTPDGIRANNLSALPDCPGS